MNEGNMTYPSGVEERVCEDIAKRQMDGVSKYGVTVEENKLSILEWHVHMYKKLLDAAVYVKKIIEELKKAENEKEKTKTDDSCFFCGSGSSIRYTGRFDELHLTDTFVCDKCAERYLMSDLSSH